MSTGLTTQALRRYRWSLLAPACTQVLAACVISAMVMLAWSLSAAQLGTEARAVVVASEMDDVTSVFLGSAIYLGILIVGVTMSLGIRQQLPDIALVRVVGATPGQVRRAAALQVAVLAVPASIVGWLLAVPGAAAWTWSLRSHGVLPEGARLVPNAAALPITGAIVLASSVAGALIASIRVSRAAPSRALTEASTKRAPIGPIRIGIGILLVAGGATLSAVLSQADPTDADGGTLFVMLAECIGVGLLAPIALQRLAVLLRRRFRDGLPRLAVDNIETLARSLSGALVPLVLAASFAAVKVAAHTTAARATGDAGTAADVWTDYSGTAIYVAFAGVAAVNCLVTITVNRRRQLATMQLVGGSRRSLLAMALIEAGIVTATAVVLTIVVAGVTLVPIVHSSFGRWLPYFPPAVPVIGVVLLAWLVAVGMAGPAAVLTRSSPVDVVSVDA